MSDDQPPVRTDGRKSQAFRARAGQQARERWADPVRRARMMRLCPTCLEQGAPRGSCPHPVTGQSEIVSITKALELLNRMRERRVAGVEDWDAKTAAMACETIVAEGSKMPELLPWERRSGDGNAER